MIMSTCFIHARFILYCFDARLVLHQYWFACSSGSDLVGGNNRFAQRLQT